MNHVVWKVDNFTMYSSFVLTLLICTCTIYLPYQIIHAIRPITHPICLSSSPFPFANLFQCCCCCCCGCCCMEGTIQAIKGRCIHTYHSEGAGGGHAPDIITVCSHPNVIPSRCVSALATHLINTSYQPTLSTHPINPPYHHHYQTTLSTQPIITTINPSYQPTLSTHPFSPPILQYQPHSTTHGQHH